MGDKREKSAESLHGQQAAASHPDDVVIPEFELPEVLRERDPRVLLNRLLAEDPFEVRSRCARRLRERALTLNPIRLVDYTQARIAIAAGSYQGREPIEAWVELAVDISINDFVDEQHEEEKQGLAPNRSPDAEFYRAFAEITGIELSESRLACMTLNDMSREHREAFHAAVVQRVPVARVAELSGRRPKDVYDLLREVGLEVTRAITQARKKRRKRWL